MDQEELNRIEAEAKEKLQVKNRYEQLSEKVIVSSKERDDALAKVQAEAQARANAEKERDFYKDFSTNISKYPNASEYQDKILEKVKGGYSTEDAMVSVLAKEGKLSPQTQERPQQTIAGGSASNIGDGVKTLKDMSAAEKFSALKEADAAGELVDALRGR